jgi:hypothetical protein
MGSMIARPTLFSAALLTLFFAITISSASAQSSAKPANTWAIAIHGGAGESESPWLRPPDVHVK